MNATVDAARTSALELRYGRVGLLQMKLRSTDPGAILDELTGKVATVPQFFRQTAICLDLAGQPVQTHRIKLDYPRSSPPAPPPPTV